MDVAIGPRQLQGPIIAVDERVLCLVHNPLPASSDVVSVVLEARFSGYDFLPHQQSLCTARCVLPFLARFRSGINLRKCDNLRTEWVSGSFCLTFPLAVPPFFMGFVSPRRTESAQINE